MKTVLHTISSIGGRSGGTSSSVANMLRGGKIYDLRLLTFATASGDVCLGDETKIKFIPHHTIGRYCYSAAYRKAIAKSRCVLYHTHGLWEYVQYITAKEARKREVPYIVTTHSALYPEALMQSKWKKKLVLKSYLMNDLQQAACIHATCEAEMQHIRQLGIKTPIAVIPNSINICGEQVSPKSKTPRVGYLGRLHPRKCIERLLYAWHNLQEKTKGKELIIVGDGDQIYVDFLHQECKRLGIVNVIFTGFLSGEKMKETLQSFSFLALPSHFENFGMVIAEALSLKIPVIASKGTPWEQLETAGCGWWINNDVNSLTQTIAIALELGETERQEMGQRGRKLVLENYSIHVISTKMEQLYDWVLGEADQPQFVFTV